MLRRVTVAADPQNVVADQRTAVVVSPGSGAVTLLDARTLRVRKVLRGFGAPHLAALTPDGKWAFVTDDARGQLDVVSLTRLRIVKRLYVGAGAHHLSLSPDGQRLWIALGEHARELSIVDVSLSGASPARASAASTRVSSRTTSLFSPTGSRVWVTSAQDSSVRDPQLDDGRKLFAVMAGSPPQHVVFGAWTRPAVYCREWLREPNHDGRSAAGDGISASLRHRTGRSTSTLIGGNVVTTSLLRGRRGLRLRPTPSAHGLRRARGARRGRGRLALVGGRARRSCGACLDDLDDLLDRESELVVRREIAGARRRPASGRKSHRISRAASLLWTAANSVVRTVESPPWRSGSSGLVRSNPAASSRSTRSAVWCIERSRIRSTPISSIRS